MFGRRGTVEISLSLLNLTLVTILRNRKVKHIDQPTDDYAIAAIYLVCSIFTNPFTCNNVTQTVTIKDILGFKTNILTGIGIFPNISTL